MAVKFPNRVFFDTATAGTGDITVGDAIDGFLTPAQALMADGNQPYAVIVDGDDWELGPATIADSGATVQRGTPIRSVIGGTVGTTKLDLSGSATVMFTIPGEAIENLLAAADAMIFKGVIDCSANPNYPAADAGHTYRVSAAGKIGGGSGPNVEVGDLLICTADSTSSGTHGSVGSSWTITQTNIDGAVIGPASATDGGFAKFDGTTGKLLKNSAAAIAVADGGTGASTASGARTNLGLIIGSDILAFDSALHSNLPQNSKSADYTLVIGDANSHIFHPNADTSARTFTIPANSSVAFPIGTTLTFVNGHGAGVITIAITTDTMRLAGTGATGSRTLAANGMATAIKVTSTEWKISGTGLT